MKITYARTEHKQVEYSMPITENCHERGMNE